MQSIDTKLNRLRRGANGLIYASVILGVSLLAQLYALTVPSWLFYSILAGWVLYLVVAIAVATGREEAHLPVLVLSIVTLAVSLPQPEHHSLADAGPTLASLTFIVGSLLQGGCDNPRNCFSDSQAKAIAPQSDSRWTITKWLPPTESIKVDSAT